MTKVQRNDIIKVQRKEREVQQMTNKIMIGGQCFEIHRSKYVSISQLAYASGRNLQQCYDRPSTTKSYIYDKWERWAYENDVHYFGILSYNCSTFTLQGLVDVDGVTYILIITKAHNYAYIATR